MQFSPFSLIKAVHPDIRDEWEELYKNRIHIIFEKLSNENNINGMREMLNNDLYKDFLLYHVKTTFTSWWCEKINNNEQKKIDCLCNHCKLFNEF